MDTFLGHWLVLRTASEVHSYEVFPRFRSLVEDSGRPITDVVADVVRVAGSYRVLESGPADHALGRFLRRWHVVEAGVATPVLLWLLAEPGITPWPLVTLRWTLSEAVRPPDSTVAGR